MLTLLVDQVSSIRQQGVHSIYLSYLEVGRELITLISPHHHPMGWGIAHCPKLAVT